MVASARPGGLWAILFLACLLVVFLIMTANINNNAVQTGSIDIPIMEQRSVISLNPLEEAKRLALLDLPGAQFSVPAMFSPDGGNVAINMEGFSFQAEWIKKADGGCNYKGFLNGISLLPISTENPCDPGDFLAWVTAQLDKLVQIVGKEKGESLVRALVDLFQAYV